MVSARGLCIRCNMRIKDILQNFFGNRYRVVLLESELLFCLDNSYLRFSNL